MVSKALHQADDGLGELTRSIALQHQRSKRALAAEQRQNQNRPQAGLGSNFAKRAGRLDVGFRQLHRLTISERVSAAGRFGQNLHLADALRDILRQPPRFLKVKRAILRAITQDETEIGVGEMNGARNDGLEDGLGVERGG